jgi:branched-chain amino acid transport system substrate-binding protein
MTNTIDRAARVGVITDQTGPLSFMGIANANVARMVIDDINSTGGLLGRPVELFIEDSATDDGVAQVAAGRLVDADVDVVVGGIYSSTRQAIKVPVVDKAKKLYLYPEQYEGQESHPLIFCTGPVPAQQIEPFFPWLMQETGATTFYLPSADYIWPHVLNQKAREVVTARGGRIVGEEYFPLDHVDYAAVVADIMATGADVVFNTIVPPGLTPFLAQLHDAGFAARGGQLVCTYFDENFLNLVPAAHVEGLYGCLDYYRDVQDPFSIELLNRYEARYPGSAMFTAGSACTGTYRALKMWESAVNEAGSLKQHDVLAALDHARIPQGPGGPAEMVPGQHHVRMNMYIARSVNGTFEVVKNLGHIDPKESEVPMSGIRPATSGAPLATGAPVSA